MKAGTVVFAGAGPGAADLLTLRCKEAISEAGLIIYAGSLVNPAVLRHAPADCEAKDSSSMALPEIVESLANAAKAGKKVLRLHTGDPAIYGAVAEQMRELDKLGVPYEVIPGVSSVFASAAALKSELTAPGISQTVILTRMAGRTPVPEGQDIKSLASHKATMAIFLSSPELEAVVKELLAGGYPPETAAAVVHKASWPDELILRGTLANIAEKAKEAKISRQAMILVGDALKNEGSASLLYDAAFSHGWRQASAPAAKAEERTKDFEKEDAAVYALTGKGVETASKIASALNGAKLFIPEKHADKAGQAQPRETFKEGSFASCLSGNWGRFKSHVFVMAAGIVVRKIAPLLRGKLEDPAILACDECGRHVISLAGGHVAGANRRAKELAALIGAEAVITTATDVQGLKAFDELASERGWRIRNPEMIKRLNSMLLEKARIAALLPDSAYDEFYSGCAKIVRIGSLDELVRTDADGAAILIRKDDGEAPQGLKIPALIMEAE